MTWATHESSETGLENRMRASPEEEERGREKGSQGEHTVHRRWQGGGQREKRESARGIELTLTPEALSVQVTQSSLLVGGDWKPQRPRRAQTGETQPCNAMQGREEYEREGHGRLRARMTAQACRQGRNTNKQ